MSEAPRQFWIGVVSRSHVERGVAGGFLQLNHGQRAPAPLIDTLTFIRSKTHWGAAFRFGQLRIPSADFGIVARVMGCPDLAPAGDQATAGSPSTVRSGGTHPARARTSRTTSKL